MRKTILVSADEPSRDVTARLGRLVHSSGAGRRLRVKPEVPPGVAGLYFLGCYCEEKRDFERMLSFYVTILERYGPVTTGLPQPLALEHLMNIAETNQLLTTLAQSLATRSRATTEP